MAAKAPKGTTLYLRASGEGAADAVDALVALVTRDFDEAEGEAHVRTA
jgi:phosphocarrier protein HPr